MKKSHDSSKSPKKGIQTNINSKSKDKNLNLSQSNISLMVKLGSCSDIMDQNELSPNQQHIRVEDLASEKSIEINIQKIKPKQKHSEKNLTELPSLIKSHQNLFKDHNWKNPYFPLKNKNQMNITETISKEKSFEEEKKMNNNLDFFLKMINKINDVGTSEFNLSQKIEPQNQFNLLKDNIFKQEIEGNKSLKFESENLKENTFHQNRKKQNVFMNESRDSPDILRTDKLTNKSEKQSKFLMLLKRKNKIEKNQIIDPVVTKFEKTSLFPNKSFIQNKEKIKNKLHLSKRKTLSRRAISNNNMEEIKLERITKKIKKGWKKNQQIPVKVFRKIMLSCSDSFSSHSNKEISVEKNPIKQNMSLFIEEDKKIDLNKNKSFIHVGYLKDSKNASLPKEFKIWKSNKKEKKKKQIKKERRKDLNIPKKIKSKIIYVDYSLKDIHKQHNEN